ncbi:MAG: methyl-accepting chemotaxis protein [Candidatus Verstraetearchaeota archaeon]|nr:methyl-accepting chemotaxis protein [Candidatus Verstraetearchaeota archaeon]
MRQISQSVQQIAKSAQTTSSAIHNILSETEKGEAIIQDFVKSRRGLEESAKKGKSFSEEAMLGAKKSMDAINSLSEMIQKVAPSLNYLDDASKKIGDVIGTIKDVADQTSLLALNAAIEAARAGDAGRGFAVVAGEIRKLAEEAANLVNKVSDIIKKVVETIKEAVTCVEDVEVRAKASNKEVLEAISVLNNIAEAAKKFASTAESVSLRIKEVRSAFDKIENNISGLASVSEESAASSEEISSAVEEQTSAIDRLSSMVQDLVGAASDLREITKKLKI